MCWENTQTVVVSFISKIFFESSVWLNVDTGLIPGSCEQHVLQVTPSCEKGCLHLEWLKIQGDQHTLKIPSSYVLKHKNTFNTNSSDIFCKHNSDIL